MRYSNIKTKVGKAQTTWAIDIGRMKGRFIKVNYIKDRAGNHLKYKFKQVGDTLLFKFKRPYTGELSLTIFNQNYKWYLSPIIILLYFLKKLFFMNKGVRRLNRF